MSGSAMNDVKRGSFVRKPAPYRKTVSQGGEFPPASGRYILYVSLACPWASRCLAVRALKGLEDAIAVVVVAPQFEKTKPDVDDHHGWVFDPTYDAKCTADPVFGAKSIREVYEKVANPPTEEIRYTVPIFLDTETKKIVSNESSEIIRFMNREFNEFAKHQEDLCPEALISEIDAMNESTYESINNGVYKCGFAQSQEAYDLAVAQLFNRLDELEALLSKQRFLLKGGKLTEADIRLFVTLVRFDDVYNIHFKCSLKTLREYPALSEYTRDVCQTGRLESTVDRHHIKAHYYGSHTQINPFHIIALTTACDLTQPHRRANLP